MAVGENGWVGHIAHGIPRPTVAGTQMMEYRPARATTVTGPDRVPTLYPTLEAWADIVGSKIPPDAVAVLFLCEGEDYEVVADRLLALELGARAAIVPLQNEEDGPASDVTERGVLHIVRDAVQLASFLSTVTG
jgi:hypothetical protein